MRYVPICPLLAWFIEGSAENEELGRPESRSDCTPPANGIRALTGGRLSAVVRRGNRRAKDMREKGGRSVDKEATMDRTAPYAPDTAIYLQDECYKHKYVRSKDVSTIVERPGRLTALKMGIGAAIARLEAARDASIAVVKKTEDIGEELSAALGTLSLSGAQQEPGGAPDPFAMRPVDVVTIVKPDLNLKDLTLHPAVRMVHAATDDGTNDSLEHLHRLATWARESEDKIHSGESEIPAGFPQGDLYSETFFPSCLTRRPSQIFSRESQSSRGAQYSLVTLVSDSNCAFDYPSVSSVI